MLDATKKLANPPKARLRDYIAILLDASGSMSCNSDRAYGVLREQFENIGRLQQDPDRDVYLNYYTFNDKVWPHVTNTRNTVNVPDRSHYLPHGSTAIHDALMQASLDLGRYDTGDPNTSFLVIIITDGGEVYSRANLETIEQVIRKNQLRDTWTYVYLGPSGSKAYAQRLGIPDGNVEEWDATRDTEYSRISAQNVAATQSYAQQRTTGTRATTSYFTNVGSLATATVQRELPDVTAQYKAVTVSKQTRIDDFCRYHEGRFDKGMAFYALTKPEYVQQGKVVLLRDKATKRIFGGDTRSKLGLPDADKIRVKPGNHGTWDIYVQSKSDNRLLVRGTQVLIKK